MKLHRAPSKISNALTTIIIIIINEITLFSFKQLKQESFCRISKIKLIVMISN